MTVTVDETKVAIAAAQAAGNIAYDRILYTGGNDEDCYEAYRIAFGMSMADYRAARARKMLHRDMPGQNADVGAHWDKAGIAICPANGSDYADAEVRADPCTTV